MHIHDINDHSKLCIYSDKSNQRDFKMFQIVKYWEINIDINIGLVKHILHFHIFHISNIVILAKSNWLHMTFFLLLSFAGRYPVGLFSRYLIGKK